MWHYKEIEGSYCLVDDCDQDHVLYMVDKEEFSIFLTYVNDDRIKWTMHKHGAYKDVLPHYQRYLEVYNKVNLFGKPFIITGAFPVGEINRLIDTTGYGERFLENCNIKLEV